MKKNKIKYGLSHVVVWPITAEDQTSITYGTPINIPGAVTMSLSQEGSSDPFYADNIVYYQSTANNGYSGSLEIALVPEEFEKEIIGATVDEATGALIESAVDKNTPFALAFQFDGDAAATAHIMYRCKATRPNIEGETKGDTVTPKTDSFDFVAIPRMHDQKIKAKVTADSTAYADFYKKPFEVSAGA